MLAGELAARKVNVFIVVTRDTELVYLITDAAVSSGIWTAPKSDLSPRAAHL